MKDMELMQMLPYVAPLIALQAVLWAFCLVDLIKRKHVTGGNKIIWVLVMFIQFIGPVIYLLAGRKEEVVDSD